MRSQVYIFFASLLLFVPIGIMAQKTQTGGWLGVCNYFGDLNMGNSLNSFKKIRPAAGLVYRHNQSPYITFKGTLNYGFLTFADRASTNIYQQKRNLSFFSHVLEASGHVEFNFKKFISGDRNFFFTPYLSLGFGGFYFNPKAKLNGETFNLRDYGTEGQQNSDLTNRKPYPQFQPVVPIGLGIKYWMGENWDLIVDLSYKFTFTDYLDDVSATYVDPLILGTSSVNSQLADRSGEVNPTPIGDPGRQRGDVVSKDAYLMIGVGVAYTFKRMRCPGE